MVVYTYLSHKEPTHSAKGIINRIICVVLPYYASLYLRALPRRSNHVDPKIRE